MKNKYLGYEYSIEYDYMTSECDVRGYVYTIHREPNYLGWNTDIESDEWYDTREEAVEAVREEIEGLDNGA